MKKDIILVCFLLVIVFLSLFIVIFYSFNVKLDYDKTYTSAVCDRNICQDYVFTCLDGEIISSRAISGLVVFDEDWIDKRERKTLC